MIADSYPRRGTRALRTKYDHMRRVSSVMQVENALRVLKIHRESPLSCALNVLSTNFMTEVLFNSKAKPCQARGGHKVPRCEQRVPLTNDRSFVVHAGPACEPQLLVQTCRAQTCACNLAQSETPVRGGSV